jgi:hypothetical protein
MSFTFANNFKVIHRGLNSLFPFKSVPLFCRYAEAPLHVASALCQPSYCSCSSHRVVILIRDRRRMFTHYTRKTLLNYVFEDLRKTKAPNKDDEVQNDNDLLILEGNDINDELASSDGVEIEMVDSDDESYDPANPNTYKDYF